MDFGAPKAERVITKWAVYRPRTG